MATTGAAAAIESTADRDQFSADVRDLIFLTAQLVDKKGHPIYHAAFDETLTFDVSEEADLVGIGNGSPVSRESFQSHTRRTHNGKLVAVIRSRYEKTGKVVVKASSNTGLRVERSLHPGKGILGDGRVKR